ncbi:histidinol-phosphate aminotransferase [Seinonella peptonophila]|uniref:Histidinol-phosphate aminotransferase n=1 Tax=Seinonella peptonophila TaxID=112248 RepID=A0A1M4TEZ3_9BACL|nr:histidinol-phosphate transaminase [Seinonella peptonophila]SHE42955.1 histidinol-phosphate aminotransferase [Seinonella peptonophila]
MEPKKNIREIPVYQPGKPIDEVKNEYGLDQVIKLASNENPFGCSPRVWEALMQERGSMQYYPEGGASQLSKAVADHLEVDERRLIFGNGSDEIIQLISRAYLGAGDESVLADVTFSRYEAGILIEGATPVKVPLINGTHDLDGLAAAITDKTRVVWICNPNNPTGTIVKKEELEYFLDHIPEHVLVVLDEAYAEYVTDTEYPDSISLVDYHPQLIVLRTFSKIYGLASLRIGYGVTHPDIVQDLNRVREPFNTNHFAQVAAKAALQDQSFIAYCRNQNKLGRKQIMQHLDEWNISYYPAHGNFILFNTSFSGDEVFQFLLKRGIITRSGDKLGCPNHLRVTIGTKEQNEAFLTAYAAFREEKGS